MDEKRAVLITGASSGIGYAIAIYLNSIGYQVVLVARRETVLKELATRLTDDTLCISYDLQDLENIEQIFKKCDENGIRLYGMVHCAGLNYDQPVKVNHLNDMVNMMNVNLMSFIELAKFFSKKKYSINGGAIIAMSSAAVYHCEKGMCAYSASKAGVDTAVRVMSKEFAKREIRVNSIQPNYVDTPMSRETTDFETKFAKQPLGVIKPEYIAYLAEFLLSEKSKYISGSNIKMSAADI